MMDSTTSYVLQRVNPSDLQASVDALDVLRDSGSNEGRRVQQWLPLSVLTDFAPSSKSNNNKDDDDDEERPFLQTSFNQIDDHKAYQSPWTGHCYSSAPKKKEKDSGVVATLYRTSNGVSGGSKNSKNNNELEQQIQLMAEAANEVWDAYRQLYYGNDAVGSVFIRPKGGRDASSPSKASTSSSKSKTSSGGGGGEGGTIVLECLFGIHKVAASTTGPSLLPAVWDCLHYVTVQEPDWKNGTCEYRVESAVWCSLRPPSSSSGGGGNDGGADVSLSALLNKETSKTCRMTTEGGRQVPVPISAHIENIGTILEIIEMEFRTKLERVHMPKAIEVMRGVYRPTGQSGTVHLMRQQQQKQGTTTTDDEVLGGGATGMGVGSEMIGEIAQKARSKGLGDDEDAGGGTKSRTQPKVLDSMAQRKKEQEQLLKEQKENNKAANEYNDLKAGLKKGTTTVVGPGPNGAGNNIPASPGGTTNPWGDARAGLKSRRASDGTYDVTSPSPTKLKASVSATPEFLDFRNKLKSPMRK